MDKIERLKNMSLRELGNLLASGDYTPEQCQKMLEVWRKHKKQPPQDYEKA